MKRIYFLVPNIISAKSIVNELIDNDTEEKHIHLIASEGVSLEGLPDATLLQRSDFIPAVERGIAIGGTTGLLAGLVAMSIPGYGAIMGGGILIATTLAGAGVGTLLGSMVALDIPNSRHKSFQKAIEDGGVLMLVDTPKAQVGKVTELILRHHPEAELEDIEPRSPLIPPGY
jgi:hypothetical protein